MEDSAKPGKQPEEAPQTSEEYVRTVLESTADGILAVDAHGNVKHSNRRFSEMWRIPRGLLDAGKDDRLLEHVLEQLTDPDAFVAKVERLYGSTAEDFDVLEFKDGRVFERYSCPLTRDGKPDGRVWSFRDVTERKHAEEALLRAKLLSEEYINSLPGLFYVFDEKRFVKWNTEWERATGYSDEELAGKYGTDFFEGDDRNLIADRMRKVFQDGSADVEANLVTKDGRRIPYYFNGLRKYFGGKAHLVGLGIDITARKRAEEALLDLERQVQHAQKLESLGVLAGGIAHDFNNILMVVLGNAELALDRLSPMSPARGNLMEIEQASKRAADLAKQMLAYSGKGRFVVEPIDLGALVEEMAHLLDVSISKKAVLKYNFAENLPSFNGDATQIRQVIMNLITNASEAIGDRSGSINLTTGAMECDRAYLDHVDDALRAGLDEPLPEGIYTYLEVTDTGCGMSGETIDKIFDPFFTTKFTGRGLGMSAVLGIVRGHRGAIIIYSEVGKGTTFKVLFPAAEPAVNDLASSARAGKEVTEWYGNGTVLIADDEEMVRTVSRGMLERIGFSVLAARDGREALDVFRENKGEIVCVLLDLTMPHMDGEEVFREIRRIEPGVPIILCSGYNEQDATRRFAGKGLAGFVQKPYTLETLRNKIRDIIPREGKE